MNVWATYDEIDSSNRSSYLQQTAINTDEYLAKKQTDTSEAMSIMPLIEGQGVSLLNKGVEVGVGKLKNLLAKLKSFLDTPSRLQKMG